MSDLGVSAGGDRGIPGIEAVARVIDPVAWMGSLGAARARRRDAAKERAQRTVAAFLAAEPPADVLKALLEAQPNATARAVRDVLMDARAPEIWPADIRRAIDLTCATAAVASLKPKEGRDEH